MARNVERRLTFGKDYKGWRICDVPHGYLNWILETEFDWMDEDEEEDLKADINYYFDRVKASGGRI